jgi:hypothetical protein
MKSISLSLLGVLGVVALVPVVAQAKPEKKTSAMASKTRTTKSGLKITDLKIGTGAKAVAGKTVSVNYRGTLSDGKLFDQSYGRSPFDFNSVLDRSSRAGTKAWRV